MSSDLKYCPRCDQHKPKSDFYRNRSRHDGLAAYCKECKNALVVEWQRGKGEEKYKRNQRKYRSTERFRKWVRKYRKSERYKEILDKYHETEAYRRSHCESQKRHRRRHPQRAAARAAVSYAIKSGRLLPATEHACLDCGVQAEHYHHESYAEENWLNVVPLCVECHFARHDDK